MLDVNECCCAPTNQYLDTKKIKDTAIFKYKDQIYVVDNDITYQDFYYYEDENGNKYHFFQTYYSVLDMKIPEGVKVIQKTGYAVKKGYQTIEIFETEQNAKDFIAFIYDSIK
jgi:hypothetical protein